MRVCLDALDKLPPRADDDVILSLVRVIRRLSDSKEEKQLRDRVGKLLARLTSQEHGGDAKAWSDWLTKTHPELAAKLGGADGVDLSAWKKRLAGIDWSAGRRGARPGHLHQGELRGLPLRQPGAGARPARRDRPFLP